MKGAGWSAPVGDAPFEVWRGARLSPLRHVRTADVRCPAGTVTGMLIAHDLVLLLLDDDTGKTVSWLSQPDKALAGAVLVDLAARGLVDVADDGEDVRKGRLVVRAGAEPTEPLLRRALDLVRSKEGKKADAVLGPLSKGLRDELADDLIAAGILRREEHKVLGLFRTQRLPVNDDAYETALRSRLHAVLTGSREPDDRTGPIIALLHATDTVTQTITVDDKKAARKRAKEIATGQWAGDVVRAAVQAVQSAVFFAVLAPAGGASAGAGGG